MVLKKEIFKQLDEVCKPGCILATNTSFLSIDEMADATKRPGDVIGMHFFSPANVMPLLENVRGAKSSPETIATAMAMGTKIGKWPVLAGNCHGFLANRAMANNSIEARAILSQGSSIQDIDRVATTMIGLPLGPFSLTDLTGTGIGVQARKRNGTFDPERNVLDWIIDQGREGMKNGAGWYDYDQNRKKTTSPAVMARIEETRKKYGNGTRDFSDQELFERQLYPIVNECFKILEEGFAVRPADIDVTLCHGYNWPRVTGGPLHMADNTIGLQKIAQALQKYASENPNTKYFKPSQLMLDCVNANQTLAVYWAKNSQKYAVGAGGSKL
jgi:3-hydroxyacyl-CoA dehydrogenase